jgi:anti-sigma regulatory factor (Ser/Thr protein kinase)
MLCYYKKQNDRNGVVMKEISIMMSAYLGFVPGVRTAIGRIAYNFGFDDTEAYEIETIIDEICTNAIEHGSKGGNKNIIVDCKFDKNVVEISIRDSGSPSFKVKEVMTECERLMAEEAEKIKLDTIRRGRGLMIVKNFVDKLDISSSSEGTLVQILKKSHKA